MLTHRRPCLLAALVLCLSFCLTACGGEDDPSAESSGTPSASLTGPGIDPSQNFTTGDEFIEAVAANTAESLAAAQELVAPKSAAARYLTAAAAEAPGDGPLALTEVGQGRYRLCAGSECSVLSDLVLADGKISSFKVDGKQAR